MRVMQGLLTMGIALSAAGITVGGQEVMDARGTAQANETGSWHMGMAGEEGGVADPRHGRHHMRRAGMRHRAHDPVARLLDHQTYLKLSATQVNSLIAIDEKLHADNKPLMERLGGFFHRGESREGNREQRREAPDPARRDSVVTIMTQLRENAWRANATADAVLSAEQLNLAGGLDHRAR